MLFVHEIICPLTWLELSIVWTEVGMYESLILNKGIILIDPGLRKLKSAYDKPFHHMHAEEWKIAYHRKRFDIYIFN